MRSPAALLSLLFCCSAVFAADEDHSKDHDRQLKADILPRNVKLEFWHVPSEKEDKGTYLITAHHRFQTGIRLHGTDGGGIKFEVNGEVRLLDTGEIFVRFEAHTGGKDKKGQAEFSVAAGVRLKPGKEFGVSRMGDKTFMIRASLVD